MLNWPERLLKSSDEVQLKVRQTVAFRLAACAVFGALIGLNVNLIVGLAWLGAAVGSVALTYPFKRQASVGKRYASLWNWVRLSGFIVSGVVWSALGVTFWFAGDPALRIVALVLLSSLLILAQGASANSLISTVTLGVPSAATILALPLWFGGLHGLLLTTVASALGLMMFYVANDVRRNIAIAAALRKAQLELIEQKEAAIAANRAKSAFLAMMSHELRTPMTGVLGMAAVLKLSKLDARQAEQVGMLVRSGDRLMAILNDILDLSKIEAGKLELEEMAFDLAEVGRCVHDLWTDAASAKGVRLVYEAAPQAPLWVMGDPTRIRQIMLNLVSNALKFTAIGEVRLSIARILDGPSAPRIEIAVSDTGVGLSKSQQDMLFQAFVQADASTSRRFGGTGLGLSICKQLATLMGGDITLESFEGVGSTFTVSLPLPPAEPQSAVDASDGPIDLAGFRLLVADDNAINRAVARALLEAAGAEVSTAEDGLDALDQLLSGKFDLVLMDVHMPRMDGIDALKAIRAGEAGPANIPVLALTADAMAGEDSRLMELGFDGVQQKPIQLSELLSAIAAACGDADDADDAVERAGVA